eukprot:78376-Chlamydomonas_euryale.AAC.5
MERLPQEDSGDSGDPPVAATCTPVDDKKRPRLCGDTALLWAGDRDVCIAAMSIDSLVGARSRLLCRASGGAGDKVVGAEASAAAERTSCGGASDAGPLLARDVKLSTRPFAAAASVRSDSFISFESVRASVDQNTSTSSFARARTDLACLSWRNGLSTSLPPSGTRLERTRRRGGDVR